MKIQTFTIVVGGNKCNASCPYCVSKLTGKTICSDKVEDINIRNFHKACQFAKMSGVSTILLTGKGEPLLYPDHITKYLKVLQEYNFPFIELQTNGIELPHLSKHLLEKWYNLGLTTVSLSCVHWVTSKNKEIFGSQYVKYDNIGDCSFQDYIDICHKSKFSVRVSCVMVKGYIDSVDMIQEFADKCKELTVEQFTVRPVTNIKYSHADNNSDAKTKIYQWILRNRIERKDIKSIKEYFDVYATILLDLAHGARVYDYKGQNLSISNCLTETTNPDDIRQLIFYQNGRLMYSWTNPGAIII